MTGKVLLHENDYYIKELLRSGKVEKVFANSSVSDPKLKKIEHIKELKMLLA